jgi:cellulose synthase/poly-beta-1,6-N-acetylglucosamine synthase-like glycosyltransferase
MITFLLVWLAVQTISVTLVWVFTIGLGKPVNIDAAPPVVVLVAVKGPDPEFEHFLAGLFAQDYPSFRVIFAVESADDPAVAQIAHYQARIPERIALAVAGQSQDEGQKSANLRAALKQISAADEVVVLADANIRPGRDWLKRLVAPLTQGTADIVSGYAWVVPENNALSSFVLAAMSHALVAIPRLPLLNAAWGGSTAMRRERCEMLDLDAAWRGTISDDLQLTVVAQRAGCAIAVPREILLRSFVAPGGFSGLAAEAVRWMLLFRFYMPATYVIAMAGLSFTAAGWIVTFAATIGGLPGASAVLLAAFALMALRTAARTVIVARLWGKAGLKENGRFLVVDPLIAPLASLTSAACGWAALCTRHTTWAGITYRIDGPQQVKVLSRRQAAASQDIA